MWNLNFIIHEPADEYHARSRSGEFMSSHLLADFRESPSGNPRLSTVKRSTARLNRRTRPPSFWGARRTV